MSSRTDYKISVMAAYEQGKPIERLESNGVNPDWVLDDDPIWDWYDYEYRIAPEPERMTNMELSRWLATGEGEKMNGGSDGTRVTQHCYPSGDDGKPVKESIRVRRWGSLKWEIPSKEMYREAFDE